MITEDRQSESFGRWLETGGPAPEDVDGDVLEAAYAFRPELAPGPRATIEEILAHLDEAEAIEGLLDGRPVSVDADVREPVYALRPELAPAPTATIDEIWAHVAEAAAVEAATRGEQPALDADVAEAIYALRPEAAPAPKATIDDILARVDAGPLAAPKPANVVPFPAATPAIAVAHEAANKPFPARRGVWRVLAGGGAVGLLAAAAAVSLFIAPLAEQIASGPPPAALNAPVVSTEAAPVGQAERKAESEGPVAVDASATDAPKGIPELDDPSPRDVAAAPAKSIDAKVPAAAAEAPREEAVVDGLSGPSTSDEYFSKPQTTSGTSSGWFGGDAVSAPPPAATPPMTTAPKPPAPAAAPVMRGASASNTVEQLPELQAVEKDKQAKESASGGAAGSVATTSTTVTRATSPTAPGLAHADAATLASLGAIEAQAKALAGAGDYAGAGRALLPAIVAPREAGQYYAAMAAEWFLAANDTAAARDAVQRGLGLGNPVRADLQRAAAAVSRAEAPAATAPTSMDSMEQ